MVSWTELPESLTSAAVDHLGGPIAIRVPETKFGSDFAGVLTVGATRVFAKAARVDLLGEDYQIEIAVAHAVPRAVATPRLRFVAREGGWILMCFDAIDGHHPGTPWTEADVNSVLDAVATRAEQLTPTPLAMRSVADLLDNSARFRVWRDLSAGVDRDLAHDDLPAWCWERLDDLAGLEAKWAQAAAGTTLLHFDPRPDNYIIEPAGRAWVLDWGRACLGAAWIDLVTFLADPMSSGPQAQAVFETQAAAVGAREGAVNAYLAALSGYWINEAHRPSTPMSPRGYQRRSGVTALDWLHHRLTG